jgi:hypothetical protein
MTSRAWDEVMISTFTNMSGLRTRPGFCTAILTLTVLVKGSSTGLIKLTVACSTSPEE